LCDEKERVRQQRGAYPDPLVACGRVLLLGRRYGPGLPAGRVDVGCPERGVPPPFLVLRACLTCFRLGPQEPGYLVR